MIHYHGLPITPTEVLVSAMRGRHCLVSFAYPGQIELAAEICQSIVLDNGAFSAWRSKTPLDFDGYCIWVDKWLRHPGVDWCLIPDVIDGSAEENDRMILRFPVRRELAVPVFHLHEDLSRLKMLMRNFHRIALGSSGDYSVVGNAAWWERMKQVMAVLCYENGAPKVKIHGLRMLNPKVFTKLPLTSADSCNVARNVGIDKAWAKAYAPAHKTGRAIVLADRIESHQSAALWAAEQINET